VRPTHLATRPGRQQARAQCMVHQHQGAACRHLDPGFPDRSRWRGHDAPVDFDEVRLGNGEHSMVDTCASTARHVVEAYDIDPPAVDADQRESLDCRRGGTAEHRVGCDPVRHRETLHDILLVGTESGVRLLACVRTVAYPTDDARPQERRKLLRREADLAQVGADEVATAYGRQQLELTGNLRSHPAIVLDEQGVSRRRPQACGQKPVVHSAADTPVPTNPFEVFTPRTRRSHLEFEVGSSGARCSHPKRGAGRAVARGGWGGLGVRGCQ
jgi:hypothetical protein